MKSPKSLSKIVFALLLPLSTATFAEEAGFLDLQVDTNTGQVRLSLERLPLELLYVPALQSGVGSNDLGLDRGQLDRTRLVRFERFGNRILLIEPNLDFRAVTNNQAEVRSVTEAFAQSVIAGFEIIDAETGTVSIDLAPLLLSDMLRISTQIKDLEQGSFEVDPERSAVDANGIRNFPQNTLIPVVLTFKGSEPGSFIEDVTPTPDALTVRVTHQFVQLPDGNYQPRAFHPRSGYFALQYKDYAAPLESAMDQRLIYRHRLEPGEPLIYYVDNGTPEPVRSALLEGASWWAEAFAAAGFPDSFKVEVLPEGADPLDVRYNVIQWVHRATRGWSYGFSVSDPRTGEIIKGHVSLGSLRVRQDQLIAEALTAPFEGEGEGIQAARELALARLRQLSAHEVGHTLGIDHNFAASYSNDASTLDYPHPYVYLDEQGLIRLDKAYQTGVSPWDILTVRYGYTEFDPADEARSLAAILDEAEQQNIAFIADQDARVPGSAHPAANLWDNGTDSLQRLDELLAIRRIALENFSEAVVPAGTSLFEIERRLVPVFLLHRYQIEAVAKLLGGLNYDYRLRGDSPSPVTPVDAETQKQALQSLINLLEVDNLALPESLHYLIPPPPSEHRRDRENFPNATGVAFDHLAPARAAIDLVLTELLQAQRLSRLADQHALDGNQPAPDDLMSALMAASWQARIPGDGYQAAIQTELNWLVLRHLMALATNTSTIDSTRALGLAQVIELGDTLQSKARKGDDQARAAAQEIRMFLQGQATEPVKMRKSAPPGSPIG